MSKLNKMAGVEDCVEALAMQRGISKAEARSIMNDVVEIIATKCAEGGISFKGVFTIKPKVRKGRSGVCSFNNKEWETEDKLVLSINTGSAMMKELNK